MISFINYKGVPEQLEVIVDKQGIEELIEYLKFVKQSEDHIHLTLGTELHEYPENLEPGVINVKSVRLEFYKSDILDSDVKVL
ncbi:hypothetical protein [Chryseobacterium candidae]|uniref:Uncharacterized protein n=1 Tax=Chryseobacterium candidae TaxID=1978493 RepID=A0ABY2R3P1_9FLAO|nr:hypothetical protein [Chryseobacterium candidae]THV57073.1 hypothetical protein EK417_16545 [Chryseobacterium candidae]